MSEEIDLSGIPDAPADVDVSDIPDATTRTGFDVDPTRPAKEPSGAGGGFAPGPPGEYLIQGRPLSYGQRILRLFKEDPEKIQAKAGNALSYADTFNIPPSTAYQYHDEISKRLGGEKLTTPELVSRLFVFPITAGLMAHPLSTILGIATFEALGEAESAAIALGKGETYRAFQKKGLVDLLPEDVNELTKTVVDTVDFMAKGMAAKGMFEKAPGLAEKVAKKITVEHRLPRSLYIDPADLKAELQRGGVLSAEEAKIYGELGLSGSAAQHAIERGLHIAVPVERITRISDKPYFARLKKLFRIDPEERHIVERQRELAYKLGEAKVEEAVPTEPGPPKLEARILKPEKGPEPGADLEAAYDQQKDIWFGRRDVRLLQTDVETRLLQRHLKTALGQMRYNRSVRDIDQAIQIYIDTKRNPEHVKQYYDQLTDEQRRIVDLSQKLPDEAKGIADRIQQSYEQIGLEALDQEVIANVLENYAGRIWNLEGKEAMERYRKFGTTTRHARHRKFETIIEGQANDFELRVKGATSNLQILKEEVIKTIENKRFLKALKEIKDVDGRPLITTQQLEGYVQVEHPNFIQWSFAGEAEPGKVYGKNFFVTDEGTVLERRPLYAPEAQAKNLNNILGTSRLTKIPGIPTITKYNAIVKAWILQTSFFHHLAFMRSYYFGTQHKTWGELNIRRAYRDGLIAIESLQPEIELGVKNGLTLGLRQDWQEHLLREKTIIGKILDKTEATKEIKDAILALRERQADFLFGEFGAGLKAKSFLIEYRNELRRYPDESPDAIAKRVASLINDDFGGLHLGRLGRNPSLQHIFRLFALAPDWTESNIRTMVKSIKAGSPEEAQLYRKFWIGVVAKAGALTALSNFLLAGGDPREMEDNYRAAWQSGNLRLFAVDVTSIYQALGGQEEERKYFSIFGHFRDPLKFITHPIRSAHHKGSVIYGTFHEAMAGTDWKGDRFTTFPELIGRRKTVTYGPGGPIDWEQFPSYVLSQVIGTQPVQVQNLIAWSAGEIEGFEAVANSLGLGVVTGRPRKKRF